VPAVLPFSLSFIFAVSVPLHHIQRTKFSVITWTALNELIFQLAGDHQVSFSLTLTKKGKGGYILTVSCLGWIKPTSVNMKITELTKI